MRMFWNRNRASPANDSSRTLDASAEDRVLDRLPLLGDGEEPIDGPPSLGDGEQPSHTPEARQTRWMTVWGCIISVPVVIGGWVTGCCEWVTGCCEWVTDTAQWAWGWATNIYRTSWLTYPFSPSLVLEEEVLDPRVECHLSSLFNIVSFYFPSLAGANVLMRRGVVDLLCGQVIALFCSLIGLGMMITLLGAGHLKELWMLRPRGVEIGDRELEQKRRVDFYLILYSFSFVSLLIYNILIAVMFCFPFIAPACARQV